MYILVAISLLVCPSATSRSTSSSRSVSTASSALASARPPIAGSTYRPPLPTVRIARTRSVRDDSLSTYPAAPAFHAGATNAGSSSIVRITIAVSGEAPRISNSALRLSSRPMWRSSRTTEGVRSRRTAHVSCTSLLSPTTARSSSASSSRRRPWRTTAWSSAITIVSGVPGICQRGWIRLAGLGEVRLSGLDDHRLVEREVADRDHAPRDHSQGTVAAVAYPPFGSSHGRRGKVPAGTEVSLSLAPQKAEDAGAQRGCLRLLPLRSAHRALELVLQHEVGEALERALLEHLEAAPEEV